MTSTDDSWFVRPSTGARDARSAPEIDDLLPGIPRNDVGPRHDPEPRPPSVGRPPATRAHGMPAGILTRGIARVVDGVLTTLVTFAVLLSLWSGDVVLHPALGAVVSVLVPLAYHVYFEVGTGQTVAKRWLSLQVKNDTDQPPTWRQSLARNAVVAAVAVPVVGWLLLLAIVLSMARNPRHRGLHDDAGGTTVVQVV